MPAATATATAATHGDAPVRGEVASRAWEPALTRRLRVLLHATPLIELKQGDGRRDPELRHYDALVLALKVVDLVVEHTGLEHEVDRGAVERALEPLLSAMDASAMVAVDPLRHGVMIDRVLGALRNDAEARRPFEVQYRALRDDGSAALYTLSFRLAYDQFRPSGGTVLRLSDEAVNLYLNALELDIEDAQAAAEAVVESQLRRGRFHEAAESARAANLQSQRFHDKLVRVLRSTRRDVASVDWRAEVPRLLDDALHHIESRFFVEDNILAAARARLDLLTSGDAAAESVAEVAEQVRACRMRHVDLHDLLMGARNVFLSEQARQSFVPPPPRLVPDLTSQVVEPLLALPVGAALPIVEESFAALTGASAPPLLSLHDLVCWQLRPRRTQVRPDVAASDLDAGETVADVLRFPDPLRERAMALYTAALPTTLSALLERAAAAGEPASIRELIALVALQHYAPEPDDEGAAPRVERRAHVALEAAGFAGDDLDLLLPEGSVR